MLPVPAAASDYSTHSLQAHLEGLLRRLDKKEETKDDEMSDENGDVRDPSLTLELQRAAEGDDSHDTTLSVDPQRELVRLIRRSDESTSVKDANLRVDALMRIALKHPELFQQRIYNGRLLPLHLAMENKVPLEMITILVETYPAGLTRKYSIDDGVITVVILRAGTLEIFEYLLDQTMRYLRSTHSTLIRGWEEIHLFYASHYNIEDVVKRLLFEFPDFAKQRYDYFATLWTTTWGRRLPLHYAVEERASVAVLELLISSYPKALIQQTKTGDTPLHIACCIYHVDPAIIDILLTCKSVRVCNGAGMLPLHCYCDRSSYNYILDLQVVGLMAELHPNSIQATLSDGKTALHLACHKAKGEDIHVIRYLAYAYPRSLQMADCNGCTPLRIACGFAGEESLSVIGFLVEASPESVRQLDKFGNSVLHWYLQGPSWQTHLAIVKLLVEAYPDALRIKDRVNELTPLHIACKRAELDVICYMVEKCPEVLELDGTTTPLHAVSWTMAGSGFFKASTNCRARTLSLLQILAMSEKAVETKDSQRQTSLHVLCRQRQPREYLQVLIERSPNVTRARDHRGRIPLHAAIEGCASSIMARDRRCQEEAVLYLLETYPLGVHAVDNAGMTPLMLACEWDVSLNVIYHLLKVDPISNCGLECSQVSRKPKDSASYWKSFLSAVGSILFGA